ncbi:MAG: HEAT repeat domain-containing protein [Sphaerobacter sp.]|nr:HEAT repeat domain-containing protein [Sphaerobacter sp.]
MSSTINRARLTDPGDERILQRLKAIAEGQRSASAVAELSDVSRGTAGRIRSAWPEMPLEARRYLVRQMVDLAETNLGLNFCRILRIALEDPDPEVRAVAVSGLWEDQSTTCLDDLLALLAQEREPAVLEAIAAALGQFAYLASIDELDATRAAQVRAALIGLLHSEAAVWVRRRALESLAWWADDPEVHDEIAAAYASDDREMRVSALFGMGRSLDQRWLPTVLAEMENDDPEFRYEAAKAAGELGDPQAVDPLLSLLGDEDREVQTAAIGALGQIGGRTAINALRRLSRDEDAVVREAAEDALAQALYATDPLRPHL